mmetsp:Transcript_6903/g.12214  ORF Transcript_6903/g.12214 Transcript_6903/m.12214 type:complete len:464 (-) Transcript_6903:155-1546(-)
MANEWIRRHCHPIPVLLFIVVFGQILLMAIAARASWVMRAEWAQVMSGLRNGPESHEIHVRIVKLDDFHGPAYAIVPVGCAELEKIEEAAEDENTTDGSTSEGASTRLRHTTTGEAHESSHGDKDDKKHEEDAKESHRQLVSMGIFQGEDLELDMFDNEDEAWDFEERLLHAKFNDVGDVLEIGSETAQGSQWTCNCFLDRLPFFGPIENRTRTMEACNKKVYYHEPHWWNRYFSLMELQKLRRGGTIKDGKELHKSRSYLYFLNIFCCVSTMAVKYSLKVVDVVTKFSGPRYVQLWHNDRTKFDRIVESVLLHSNALVFTLALQLSLCSLYLTFWRDYYFVMEFIPSMGFWIYFVSQLIFTVWMVLDRVQGWMVKHGDWYIYVFWGGIIFYTLTITLPMLGYCFFSLDFVLAVYRGQWIGSAGIFSQKFKKVANQAMSCAFGFMGLAVLDVVVIIAMDLLEK